MNTWLHYRLNSDGTKKAGNTSPKANLTSTSNRPLILTAGNQRKRQTRNSAVLEYIYIYILGAVDPL